MPLAATKHAILNLLNLFISFGAVIVLALSFAATANAGDRRDQFIDRFAPQWQANCQSPQHRFRLVFKSEGGDSAKDDLLASIQWGGKSFTSLPLKPTLFVAGRLKSDVSSKCDNVTAVLLSTGNLLVVLRRDDRPSEDRLLAVLLDGKTGKTLNVISDLGAETDQTVLVKYQHGFRIRLVRKWLQRSPQQEPTPILDWVKLDEANGKISMQWQNE